jgi:hypothetical protein
MEIINIVLQNDAVMCNDAEKTYKHNICKVCSLYENGMCASCGCIVEVKVSYKNQSCPEGKW